MSRRFIITSSLLALTLATIAGSRMCAEVGREAVTPHDTVADSPAGRLVAAAVERTSHRVRYDPAYRTIPYPGGDVPDHLGVCTDVVIRSYRKIGIDLQYEVHNDMKSNFNLYPKRWGLSRPDPNIDHRRVPNLEVFFGRHGESLGVSSDPASFIPGDLVTWDVVGRPHIGIVVDRRSADDRRYQIVHNIGAGPRLEDALFEWPMTGHFRYLPE